MLTIVFPNYQIKEVNMENNQRYLSVAQLAAEYPAFTQCSLRHLIFNASENDFDKVIRRVGKRKLLLCEKAFHEWIESQNEKGGRR